MDTAHSVEAVGTGDAAADIMAGYVATVSRAGSSQSNSNHSESTEFDSKRDKEGDEGKGPAASDARAYGTAGSSTSDNAPSRTGGQSSGSGNQDVHPFRRFMERTLGWPPSSGR